MVGSVDRRTFLKSAAAAAVTGIGARPLSALGAQQGPTGQEPLFKISLAEWSLNRTLRSGRLNNLDFPAFAKREFGIEAVEYVNCLFCRAEAAMRR
jgi:hypothetical protein